MPVGGYQPLDYSGAINYAANAVPDYADQQMKAQLRDVQRRQIGLQERQEDTKNQRQAQLQARIAGLGPLPKAEDIAAVMREFPEIAQEYKQSWDIQDAATKQRGLLQGSEMVRLAMTDRPKAAALLREMATTTGSPEHEAYATLLESKDPKDWDKATKLMAADMYAKIGDAAKYDETFGDLMPKEKDLPADVRSYRYYQQNDPVRAAAMRQHSIEGPLSAVYDSEGNIVGSMPLGALPRLGGGGTTPPPAPAPATSGPAGALFGPDIEKTVKDAIPGVTVTSGLRSPEDNKRVGGVTGSMHMTDQARDFTPPKGMKMNELGVKLRQMFPNADVINEGDHIHVESRVRAAGGGRPTKAIGGKKYVKLGPNPTDWFEVAA